MEGLGLLGVKPMTPRPPMVGLEPDAEPEVDVVDEPGAMGLPLASVAGAEAPD